MNDNLDKCTRYYFQSSVKLRVIERSTCNQQIIRLHFTYFYTPRLWKHQKGRYAEALYCIYNRNILPMPDTSDTALLSSNAIYPNTQLPTTCVISVYQSIPDYRSPLKLDSSLK